jgi:hypothetical protein
LCSRIQAEEQQKKLEAERQEIEQLVDEGLIDTKTANLWADAVWCPSEAETDEEEDL